MDIRLVTYNEELVTPLNDALIYEKAVPMNGIFYGYDFSVSGSTTIQMDGGKGLLYGREFESNNDTIDIALSSSGVKKGRLYLHMDLSNISEPIQILSYVGDTLPALIDNPDVNKTNGVTELELCTFDVGTTEITNLVKTVQVIQTATHKPATPTSNGLMSAEDKQKLDTVQTGANNYTLPTASSSTLGGVKVGTNLSINNGVLSSKDTTYSNATTSAAGLMSAADKTKLNGISSGAAVSGVKGSAETTYRTGNVNLTAANVGALALSGGTLTNNLTINRGGAIKYDCKSTEVDVTNRVNGVTETHYAQFRALDKEGRNYGNFTVGADTEGAVYSELIVRNYNTNGEALQSTAFGIKQFKNGDVDYFLAAADKLTEKLTAASTSAKGLMSAADKTKLNGIQASANNVKVAYGKHNCSTFGANAGKTITVTTGKPSGTILACIPVGCTLPVVVESVSGDNLAGLTGGKFYLKNPSTTSSGTVYLHVAWIYY